MLYDMLKGIRRPQKNVMLFLTTFGGIADEAYRIARCLQDRYSDGRFTLFVDTYCKSAGTLLALGAHELVMSDLAELGPIDVQIFKKDDIERTSGLTHIQALSNLEVETFESFSTYFARIHEELGELLSTRIITQIASRLTVGCMARIYQQIDPMRLAEYQRATLIARRYGERLTEKCSNARPKAVDRLIGDYPSHEFVIDRKEATTLFSSIRGPSDDEQAMARCLHKRIRSALMDIRRPTPLVEILTVDPGQSAVYNSGGGDGHDRRNAQAPGAPPAPKSRRQGTAGKDQPQPERLAPDPGEGVPRDGSDGAARPRRAKQRRRG